MLNLETMFMEHLRIQKNIYNELNGVEIQFSTLPMKKGEYQLYINVIENNINYGIGDTGLVFIKRFKGFSRKLD